MSPEHWLVVMNEIKADVAGYRVCFIVILQIKWFSTLFRRNNRKTSLYLQFTLGRPLSFRYKFNYQHLPLMRLRFFDR